MSLKPKKQKSKAKIFDTGKTKQTSSRPKVHGLRTCLRCKGICHEDSLRQKGKQGTGGRAHYFCCYEHMRLYYELKYYSEYKRLMQSHDRMDEYEQKMDEMAQENLERYEYVDCITE